MSSLQIRDVIAECDDGKPRERDLAAITTVAIHRVGIDKLQNIVLGTDAVTICRRFVDDPDIARYTGGQVPYTFIIGGVGEHNGVIWQCLPIAEIGAHARRWNTQAIGVACVGDFRVDPPTRAQHRSLVALCAVLMDCFSGLAVKGHDELAGGSRDPNKQCPGAMLDVNSLWYEINHYGVVDLVGARLAKEGIEV